MIIVLQRGEAKHQKADFPNIQKDPDLLGLGQDSYWKINQIQETNEATLRF